MSPLSSNRLLRSSLRFVSIRFQDSAALDGAAVATFKNKPAPDNPPAGVDIFEACSDNRAVDVQLPE